MKTWQKAVMGGGALVLVAGGVLVWLGINPLLASLVPVDSIARQLIKLGYATPQGLPNRGAWDPLTHTFANVQQETRDAAPPSARKAPAVKGWYQAQSTG